VEASRCARENARKRSARERARWGRRKEWGENSKGPRVRSSPRWDCGPGDGRGGAEKEAQTTAPVWPPIVLRSARWLLKFKDPTATATSRHVSDAQLPRITMRPYICEASSSPESGRVRRSSQRIANTRGTGANSNLIRDDERATRRSDDIFKR